MDFVIQFNLAGELAGKPLPSLNLMSADTLPLAVREVQKTLDSAEIGNAIIYVPVRVLKSMRRVEMMDAKGNPVAVDTPLGDMDGRVRPLVDPEKEKQAQERAEGAGLTPTT
jgi:hypothetical protein